MQAVKNAVFLVGPLCDAAAAAADTAAESDVAATASPAAATPAAEPQSNGAQPSSSSAAAAGDASDSGASGASKQLPHHNGAEAATNGGTHQAEDAADAEEAEEAEEADAVARGLSAAGLMRRMARLADERCGAIIMCPSCLVIKRGVPLGLSVACSAATMNSKVTAQKAVYPSSQVCTACLLGAVPAERQRLLVTPEAAATFKHRV